MNQIAKPNCEWFSLKASSTRISDLERHWGGDCSLNYIYTSHNFAKLTDRQIG
jgi:hypothetical protein